MFIFSETFDPASASNWGEWFFKLSIMFFIGGIAGWVIELFFRRIVHKKWVNPGFLVGPMLPIYGFGNAAMYLLCSLPYEWVGPIWAQKLVAVIFIAVLMTLIEFIAGLIFIKGMKIKLWDYSTRPGNIMGIICPLFSLIWALAGAGYLFLLYDPFYYMLAFMVANLIPFVFILGLLYGVFFVDLGYSFHIAARLKKFVDDKNLVVEWENMKSSFSDFQKKAKAKFRFAFPFQGDGGQLKASMDNYIADLKLRLEERKAKKESKSKKKDNEEE